MLKKCDISNNISQQKFVIPDNDVIHGFRGCNIVFTLERRYQLRRSRSFGGSASMQWRKIGRSWRLQMCFRRLLCVRIEIDQVQCVNCWVMIHCLSVSCTKINHSRYMLVIRSSLQLTSKQWIITQQFTAGADLFLNYIFLSKTWYMPLSGADPWFLEREFIYIYIGEGFFADFISFS